MGDEWSLPGTWQGNASVPSPNHLIGQFLGYDCRVGILKGNASELQSSGVNGVHNDILDGLATKRVPVSLGNALFRQFGRQCSVAVSAEVEPE